MDKILKIYVLIIFILQGYVSQSSGNCPYSGSGLRKTGRTGHIFYNETGAATCGWTLQTFSDSHLLIFNVTETHIHGALLVARENILNRRFESFCVVYTISTTCRESKNRFPELSSCCWKTKDAFPRSIRFETTSADESERNTFDLAYNFTDCKATHAGAARTSVPNKKRITKSTATSPEHIPTKFATMTFNGHQDPVLTVDYSTTVLNDETERPEQQPPSTGYVYWVSGSLAAALLLGLAVGLFKRKRVRNRPIPPRNVHTLETGVAGGEVNSVRIAESRGSDGRQVLRSTGSGMERPEYVSQPNPLYAAARDPDPARHADYEMVDNFSYNM